MILFEFSLYQYAVYETCGRDFVHAFWASLPIPPYWIPEWARPTRITSVEDKVTYCEAYVSPKPFVKLLGDNDIVDRQVELNSSKLNSRRTHRSRVESAAATGAHCRRRQNDDKALVQGAGARRRKADAHLHSRRCSGPQRSGNDQPDRPRNADGDGKGRRNGITLALCWELEGFACFGGSTANTSNFRLRGWYWKITGYPRSPSWLIDLVTSGLYWVCAADFLDYLIPWLDYHDGFRRRLACNMLYTYLIIFANVVFLDFF